MYRLISTYWLLVKTVKTKTDTTKQTKTNKKTLEASPSPKSEGKEITRPRKEYGYMVSGKMTPINSLSYRASALENNLH